MTKPTRVRKLTLHTTQGDAGELLRESQFVVRYRDEALSRPELAISLTWRKVRGEMQMGVRAIEAGR
ncbi:MAG: hypothetical protein ABIR73_08365 [Usitatibacter sp.]